MREPLAVDGVLAVKPVLPAGNKSGTGKVEEVSVCPPVSKIR